MNPITTMGPSSGATTSAGTRKPGATQNLCDNFYPVICAGSSVSKDPTGSVRPDIEGEVQALRLYEQVIHQNPTWTSTQIDEEISNLIYTPRKRQRLQGAFEWVEGAVLRWVERQPYTVFSEKEKKTLKKRIKRLELDIPPPASIYADEPDLFTKTGVFYERLSDGRLRLRVGGAYLFSTDSWFNIIFTLAHEFAHSIDPCELRNAHISIPAYDRLTACFLHSKLIATRKSRSECGENDQLSETFADWIAVQISGEALRKFATEFDSVQLLQAAANSVRDLCEQEDSLRETDMAFHPSPQIRIDQIFGRNPEIRELLGCPIAEVSHSSYCTFEWIPPMAGK